MAEEQRSKAPDSPVRSYSSPASLSEDLLELPSAILRPSTSSSLRVEQASLEQSSIAGSAPEAATLASRCHWIDRPAFLRMQSSKSGPLPLGWSSPAQHQSLSRRRSPAALNAKPPVFQTKPPVTPRKPSNAQLTLQSILQADDPFRDEIRPSEAEKEQRKPRLHLMGLKRSGKTSILRTAFHQDNAQDTLYLPSTREVTKEAKESVISFEVWDFPVLMPTANPASDPRAMLAKPGALIWVIDAQDEYSQAITYLVTTLQSLARIAGPQSDKPQIPRLPAHISIEIFIHKVDGLSEDFKADIFRDIQQRIAEEMDDAGLDGIRACMSFHHTSIFDVTVFEAISKVIQKLISPMHHATVEAMVNSLCANCRMEKAYLFDTKHKFYIASDTHPSDLRAYETCSDYLDVVRDIGQLYGWRSYNPNAEERYDEHHLESLVVMEKRGSRYMYMRGMNKYITLVCIMGEDYPTEIQTFVEHNVSIFQKGLLDILNRLKALYG